ncbi:MAG: DNA primase [Chloroflexi bacterium]|nr:MAG: DNA primase [Chloroflexota bacterium]
MGTIEDVKAQLDIVETVRGYVPALKRSGRTWKAPCPFHSERTPSFTVDPERNTWHCFGACATGGDVIEFVRRFEHLDFKEALRRCAERAGVELRAPSPREQHDREVHDRLLRANEAAAVYFQAALMGPAGAAALAYAERRGLDATTRETWQIGYAPDEWRGLVDHLLARGFSEADLREAGLAIDGDRGLYDRFRDRLIFPTRDGRGRMIGFGARALSAEQEPKYLNTSQTPLFDKSGSLYGIDRAGEEARRADRMVVVEGYMDVIACHQAGIRNVVASMGTSITEKQMALVQRYTQNLVLMLDADAAGSAAALRGVGVAATAAEHELVATIDWRGLVSYQDVLKTDIRVVALPAGEDPDSLVRAAPEQLKALLAAAQPVAEHLFNAVTAETDLEDPRARSHAVEALAPTVAAVADPVVRAHYVQRLARIGRVEEHTVLAILARAGHPGQPNRPTAVPSREATRAAKTAAAPPDGEAQLLQLLLLCPEALGAGRALDPDVFEDTTNRRLYESWRELNDVVERAAELDEEVADRLAALLASAVGAWDPTAIEAKYIAPRVEEIARRLRLRRAQARLLPAAVAQATEVQEARRGGGLVGEFAAKVAVDGPTPASAANEASQAAAEFVEMSARQRVLSRRARGDMTSYDELVMPSSAVPSGAGQGSAVEERDDSDV